MRMRREESYSDIDMTLSGQYHNCDPMANSATIVDATGSDKAMHDIVSRNYHSGSKKGQIFNNPMDLWTNTRYTSGNGGDQAWTTSGGSPCDQRITWSGGPYELVYRMGKIAHLPVGDINEANLRMLAGTQAMANVRAPEFEGATNLAEFREVVQMFRRPFKAYENILSKIATKRRRHSRFDTKKQRGDVLANFIADNWLQYRYGIMPIVYNLEDAVSALNTYASTQKPLRHTARGSANDSSDATETQLSSYGGISLRKEIRTDYTVQVRAGVLYTQEVANVWGLEVNDIPKAMWEVVPFSFVSDWIINVGDLISAMTPKPGVKVLAKWTTVDRTTVTTATGSGSQSPTAPANHVIYTSPTSSEGITSRWKTRYPGVSVGLAYHPLPFKGDLGIKRIADSVALIKRVLLSTS
mgnify:CR=1 FL=1